VLVGDENKYLKRHRLLFVQLALSKLVRGNELELAVSMGVVLQATDSLMFHRAEELLSWKCEKINKW